MNTSIKLLKDCTCGGHVRAGSEMRNGKRHFSVQCLACGRGSVGFSANDVFDRWNAKADDKDEALSSKRAQEQADHG